MIVTISMIIVIVSISHMMINDNMIIIMIH